MIKDIFLGIDIEGKYLVLRKEKSNFSLKRLSLEDVKYVKEIRLVDTKIEFSRNTKLSNRIKKTVLSSFENNLVLIHKAEIVDKFEDSDETVVCVEIIPYIVGLDDYDASKEYGRDLKTLIQAYPEVISVEYPKTSIGISMAGSLQ